MVRAKSRKTQRRLRKNIGIAPKRERCECGNSYCPGTVPLGYALTAIDPQGRRWRIGYDCYVNSRAKAGDHPDDKFNTINTGLIWRDRQEAAGVRVDLHECEILPESDHALKMELRLYESFEQYLFEIGDDEPTKERKRKRYVKICSMFGEDCHRRRLYQWLRNEFEGWLA